MPSMRRTFIGIFLVLWGCSSGDGASDDLSPADTGTGDTGNGDTQVPPGGDSEPPEGDVDESPPNVADAGSDDVSPPAGEAYPVGTTLVEVAAGERTLPVQLWYPATEAGEAAATETFEPEGDRRDTLAPLFADAPDACTRKTMSASQGAPARSREGGWPLVMFSHCHSCIRFSSFTVAEHLASQGFVVAAPDHVTNTVYEDLEGNPGPLSGEFLQVRAADIGAVLDGLLAASAGAPEALSFDEERIGMFGHSFGAVTTGLVMETDPRVKSGVAIAAPVEQILLPGVTVANINKPILYMLATEDNSIQEIGNTFLRNNYNAHPAPAWKVEVTDAGHWSFSDICGLIPLFEPGCGEGPRQTNFGLGTVTYIDNTLARDIARDYVLAFFQHTLLGDPDAEAFLSQASDDSVSVESHD